MSIDSINRQIATLEGEIATLEKKVAEESRKEADKRAKVTKAQLSIKNSTSQSSLNSKLREIERAEKDVVTCIKNRAQFEKQRSDKTAKLNDLRKKARDEEQKIRITTQKETKSLQQQYSSLINDIKQEQFIRQNQEKLQLLTFKKNTDNNKNYDVFISHASEDKDEVARPLYQLLVQNGLLVFYDEMSLSWGDLLRRKIDYGIANCKFGIVILSHNFFNKEWPQKELDGLFSRQIKGESVILPIWHNISKNEVLKYSPLISDIIGLNTATATLEEIAEKLTKKLIDTTSFSEENNTNDHSTP